MVHRWIGCIIVGDGIENGVICKGLLISQMQQLRVI
jgi:hypothetical protein